MRGWLLVLVCFASSSACGSTANFAGLKSGPRHATFQDRIVAVRLANGLRVALLPDPRTNLVTVEVRYNVGGADDPAGDSGLAHYVEHLLWEAALRGPGSEGLRDVALSSNAMTSLDRTYFFATALDVDLERALEVAARRLELTCDALDPGALARERDVVIEELKQRSQYRWTSDAVQAAIWGPGHPYSHGAGGDGFADVGHQTLCDFIDGHYGPSAATLVVTGNVDDGALQRIRGRFERIAARSQASRISVQPLRSGDSRITVRGLERPTAMMVFAFPGEGSEFDAAADILNGMSWRLDRGSPSRRAQLGVMGEERTRVIVAIAEVDDASKLAELGAALRRTFSRTRIRPFPLIQQQARNRFVERFEDLVAAGLHISDRFARGQRLTRYRPLSEIDALTEAKVVRWLDGSDGRLIMLVPEPAVPGAHHASELATELHDLEVSRSRATEDTTLSLAKRPPRPLIDYQLPNGLRVWLAPDPMAIAIDARLVVSIGGLNDETRKLAFQSAWLLEGQNGMKDGWDTMDRVRWYRTIGVPVTPTVATDTTTFQVTGLAVFGDWHVWNLAWTVLHGIYPTWINRARDQPHRPIPDDKTKPVQPSAFVVAMRRLTGEPDDKPREDWTMFSTAQLDAFRASAYGPRSSTLIVSGNFDVEAMRKEVVSLFGGWRASSRQSASHASAKRPAALPNFTAIPVADATTVELAIAFAPIAESPRAEQAARSVLSEILNDRLRIVREGLGVSYGVHAHVGQRAVLVGGDVEPAFASEAAHAVVAAIAQVRDGDAAFTSDFVRARKRVLARALAESVGATARADELERIAIDHGSLDQPDKDLEVIRTLDIAIVRQLAARDLRPERMIAVVRGPDASISAAFGALGVSPTEIVRLVPKSPAK